MAMGPDTDEGVALAQHPPTLLYISASPHEVLRTLSAPKRTRNFSI